MASIPEMDLKGGGPWGDDAADPAVATASIPEMDLKEGNHHYSPQHWSVAMALIPEMDLKVQCRVPARLGGLVESIRIPQMD